MLKRSFIHHQTPGGGGVGGSLHCHRSIFDYRDCKYHSWASIHHYGHDCNKRSPVTTITPITMIMPIISFTHQKQSRPSFRLWSNNKHDSHNGWFWRFCVQESESWCWFQPVCQCHLILSLPTGLYALRQNIVWQYQTTTKTHTKTRVITGQCAKKYFIKTWPFFFT